MGKKLKSVPRFALNMILLLAYSAGALAADSDLKLFSLDEAPELKSKEGYLLLDVNVGGTAPSFTVRRILETGSASSREWTPRTSGTAFTVSVKDLPRGFYVLSLRSGTYQITSINAPYFNLPFRLDTEFDRRWRFKIDQSNLNYAGQLFIDQERSQSAITVNLINRMATDEQRIKEALGANLEAIPLTSGAGFRDDFYKELNNAD